MVTQLAERDRELEEFKRKFGEQKELIENMKLQSEKGMWTPLCHTSLQTHFSFLIFNPEMP